MMRKHTTIRAAVGLAATGLALAGLSVPAHAATGTIVDANQSAGSLYVTGAPGKANNIRVEQKGNRFIVSDTADVVIGQGLCKSIAGDKHAVDCPTFHPLVDAGDGNDIVTFDNDVVPVGGTQIPAILNGGEGNDLLQATALSWAVTLRGGPGNDTHRGGRGNDDLDGGQGPDGFYGGAGSDRVIYASRTARVFADLDGVQNDGEANERDRIMTDVEELEGGSGADVLTGSSARNEIWGKGGNDTIHGLGGNDLLGGADLSGDGNDFIDGGEGADSIFGGDGIDSLHGGPGADTVEGGSGGDSIYGGTDRDWLYGDWAQNVDFLGGGDDKMFGDFGNDILFGGSGKDEMYGLDGNDLLSGGRDNDMLQDFQGADSLAGGAGDDRLFVWDGKGDDFAYGDAGIDSCGIDALDLFSCEKYLD